MAWEPQIIVARRWSSRSHNNALVRSMDSVATLRPKQHSMEELCWEHAWNDWMVFINFPMSRHLLGETWDTWALYTQLKKYPDEQACMKKNIMVCSSCNATVSGVSLIASEDKHQVWCFDSGTFIRTPLVSRKTADQKIGSLSICTRQLCALNSVESLIVARVSRIMTTADWTYLYWYHRSAQASDLRSGCHLLAGWSKLQSMGFCR